MNWIQTWKLTLLIGYWYQTILAHIIYSSIYRKYLVIMYEAISAKNQLNILKVVRKLQSFQIISVPDKYIKVP